MKCDKDRVCIFDTTLRDGEQAPGFSMNLEEKIRFAKQLETLGVDVIEAGFPVASDGDFMAVQRIAREVRHCQIAGLARTEPADIDRAWEALRDAANPRIHVFLSTSDIHLRYMLKKTRQQVLSEACDAVTYCRSMTDNVEFSAQDATRTDWEYLCDVIEGVIDRGATTVNIPDTVGYTVPDEYAELLQYLFENVKNIHETTVSVHCHDDLGLAVANSINALNYGARQVECTVNGIGERAGNASLEEIVMALRTRQDRIKLHTNIRAENIYRTSHMLTNITGIAVQPNKAIVGKNAFAHEAGIHQHGIIKEKATYEIMTPESVGFPESNLVLGKHSGRHALRDRLEKMGYQLRNLEIDRVFARFKELADIKKEIFDEDIEELIYEDIFREPDTFELLYLNVVSGDIAIPTATLRMRVGENVLEEAAFGVGPVDATFAAIRKLTGIEYHLIRYEVSAITGGTDAQGVVNVQLRYGERNVSGRGSDTDILVASAKAFLNTLNKIESVKRYAERYVA